MSNYPRCGVGGRSIPDSECVVEILHDLCICRANMPLLIAERRCPHVGESRGQRSTDPHRCHRRTDHHQRRGSNARAQFSTRATSSSPVRVGKRCRPCALNRGRPPANRLPEALTGVAPVAPAPDFSQVEGFREQRDDLVGHSRSVGHVGDQSSDVRAAVDHLLSSPRIG